MKRFLLSLCLVMFVSSLSYAFMREIGFNFDIRKTYINEHYSDYKLGLNADTNFGYGYIIWEKELGKPYVGYDIVFMPFREEIKIMTELDCFYNEGRKMNTTSLRWGWPIIPIVWIGASFNSVNEKDVKILPIIKIDAFDIVKLVIETNGSERTIVDVRLEKDFPLSERVFISPTTILKQVNTEYYWGISGNLKIKLDK